MQPRINNFEITEQQLRIYLAMLEGWTNIMEPRPNCPMGISPDGGSWAQILPDYTSDLNKMRVVELNLPDEVRAKFRDKLFLLTAGYEKPAKMKLADWRKMEETVHASALVRAQAVYLATKN